MKTSSLTLQARDPGRAARQSPSVLGLTGRGLLRAIGLHPDGGAATRLDGVGRKALCVATNHGVLDIGVATGVFASELTVPYYAFLDAGMQVDLASPRGGVIPARPWRSGCSTRRRRGGRPA